MQIRFRMIAALALAAVAAMSAAEAQDAHKEIKVKKGHAAVVANLVASQPNCQFGAVPVPRIVETPKHGQARLAIVPVDIAAAGNCPARRINAIAIIYAPQKDFTGQDDVTIELIAGNRTVLAAYRLTVEDSM